MNWQVFPSQDVLAAVTTLSLDPARDALVAGSLGAGLFVIPLAPLH